jgi:uncharacterized phosphosugar-binding protein
MTIALLSSSEGQSGQVAASICSANGTARGSGCGHHWMISVAICGSGRGLVTVRPPVLPSA